MWSNTENQWTKIPSWTKQDTKLLYVTLDIGVLQYNINGSTLKLISEHSTGSRLFQNINIKSWWNIQTQIIII